MIILGAEKVFSSFLKGFGKSMKVNAKGFAEVGKDTAKVVGKTLFDEIPKEERDTIMKNIIPYKLKSNKIIDNGFVEEAERGFDDFKDKEFVKNKYANAILKSPTTGAIKLMQGLNKPGGLLIVGAAVIGMGFGLSSSHNNDQIKAGGGQQMANSVDNILSPEANDPHVKVNGHGLNQYGADPSIVFALHNLRNGG